MGERNERCDQLVELCCRNDLLIINTFFKFHPRSITLNTLRSPDKITGNQIDYIVIKTRWKRSKKQVTTIPVADCGTEHTFLIAEIKIKLKPIQQSKQTPIYDFENFGLD